jgi:maltose alpha-D-glucosyltransferase/alpha-amylase
MEGLWHKNAIVYTVDVQSFADGNGDGVGDFLGLAGKLDYLSGLNVNCLWLQPFFPSPGRDHGYDISDYYGIDPRLGTLGDFVEFSQAARDRGIRIIADLVVNHIDRPFVVSGGAARFEIEIPELVRVVEGEAAGRGTGDGVPWGAEDYVDVR